MTSPDPLPFGNDAIDALYARDCGWALARLLTAPVLRHRTYNVGSGRATSNREFVEALRPAVDGFDLNLPDRENPAPIAWMDIERLRADTGFEPIRDLDRTVAEYVAWLRAGRDR
jgi:UDP-glucose 4-epimerase